MKLAGMRLFWRWTMGCLSVVLLFMTPQHLPLSQEAAAPATGVATAAVTPGESTYIIGKEDVLEVVVFDEENLGRQEVPVRPDGKISLPLVGDVMAAGETPEALGARIEMLYTDHVKTPSVTVVVIEINSFKVFVLGNVVTPGVLNFGKETRLLQALAMAGGFTEFANTKKLVLIREDGNEQKRMEISYEKIVSGQNLGQNLRLKPGDTIVVP